MLCRLPDCTQLLSGHLTQTKIVPQLPDSAGWTAGDGGRKILQCADVEVQVTSTLAFPDFFPLNNSTFNIFVCFDRNKPSAY